MSTEDATPQDPCALSDERVDRLYAAIRALDFTHSNPVVFFHMTIDLIMITFGRPLAARISMAGRPQDFFQTASGLSEMHEHPMPVVLRRTERNMGTDVQIRLYKPRVPGETDDAVERYLSSAYELVSRVSSRMRGGSRPIVTRKTLGSLFLEGLVEVLKDSKRVYASDDQIRIGVHRSQADRALEGFFEELQQLFLHQDYNVNFEDIALADGLVPMSPRLLFSHYFVNQDKQTELRLHLLHGQRAALERSRRFRRAIASAKRTNEGDYRNATLHKIFPGLKAAAASGIATWLESAHFSDRKRREPWRALILPIHVQGLPWLIVSVLFTPREKLLADAATREEWAQHFYMHFFPQVIATVRQLADDSYLREVEKLAKQVLKEEEHQPLMLEAALAPLTAVFPYSDIQLEPWNSGSHHKKIEWQGHAIACHPRPNHGHARGRRWIPYRTLERERLPNALLTAQKLFEAEERGKEQTHGGAYFNFSHTIKNLVESTGWEYAISKVAPISDYCSDDADWHGRPEIRGRVVEALDLADRALSLSLLVKGFAYFGRVLGLRREDIDLGKFSSWLPDPDEPPVADDEVLGIYAKSITHFAYAICFGRKWTNVEFDYEVHGLLQPYEFDRNAPFNANTLHFPPFVPKAEAAYPFIFAVAEPLQNAINALKLFPKAQQPSLESPIRISVRRDRKILGGVVVTIANLSLEGRHRPRSGLADAHRMLEPLGLARFSPLRFNPVGPYFRATMDVTLNPLELARRIRRDSR